jgi:ribosomal protein L3
MHGFAPTQLPSFLFDFQASLVEWALRKGRGGIFADCGLGKTPMYLAWADAIVRRENKPVLVLLPLAVAPQTLLEAEKFGVAAVRSSDGTIPPGATIVLANYERLHHFDASRFAGVVCDESSILKSFDGTRRGQITEFMKKRPYRLLCTATAAPNDYVELGTSSEALGELGFTDVLARFFKNDLNNAATGRGYLGAENKWRFKGHAEEAFWRWVSSWARALRKPSDLGFDDARFVLPPLEEVEHIVGADDEQPAEGMLFAVPAQGLKEQREESRRTLDARCEGVAHLTADTGQPALVWCHLNTEGDRLERLIPGAVQVSGADSDDAKEEKLLAFTSGQARVLVTKEKIAGWGLNFQHCAHVTSFPSHSYEGYYQGVRRCWRFGQTRTVRVDSVTTPGQAGVLANRQRKAIAAVRMFDALVAHMHHAVTIDRGLADARSAEVPSWL